MKILFYLLLSVLTSCTYYVKKPEIEIQVFPQIEDSVQKLKHKNDRICA
jgi:hypothetical protein